MSTPSSTLVMEARGLVKRYGHVTALDGLTLDVEPGIIGLLGHDRGLPFSTGGVQHPEAPMFRRLLADADGARQSLVAGRRPRSELRRAKALGPVNRDRQGLPGCRAGDRDVRSGQRDGRAEPA